jgi:hypothetical protein
MFFARTHFEVNNARSAIERISKLSDNIVGFGPFGIGIDGILAWVPIVGDAYSIGAGLVLLALGWRVKAPISTLISAGALVAARSGVDLVPVAGPLIVDFFRGHKMAADMLLHAIDSTVYVEGRKHPSNPNYMDIKDQIRSGAERRRVVFLG